jgi:hypothetical protein
MITLIPPSSGSIQGVTYSHNRGGAYTRKRATPVVGTRTTRQGVVKGNMTAASQAWQLLPAATQGAWTSYANGHPITNRLGSSIKLSGSQYFIKCAAALLNANQPLPTVPPVSTTIQPVVVDVFALSNTPAMVLTLTAGTPGDFILVAVAKWTSAGVNFNKTFSQVAVVGSDETNVDVMDAWETFAGANAIGQKGWIRLTPVNAGGLTGSPIYIQALVGDASGVSVPTLTSATTGHVTATWSGLTTIADVEYQIGPTTSGPWSELAYVPSVASPNIHTATSAQHVRALLVDPATNTPGNWSGSVLVT